MTGRSSRAVTAALLLCLAAPVVVSCTAPAGPAPAASALRETTAAERATLARAEKLLTRDCMRKKGFSFWVTEELPRSADELFPYVVDDEAWATENGYGRGIRDRREALAARDPNQVYFRGLSPERRSAAVDALNGPEPVGLEAHVPGMGRVRHSDRGCEAEAQRSLYTDLPKWYRARKVTEALDIQVQSAVVADPGFAEAVTRWSACMRAEGHAYASPPESRRTFLRSKAEGATATATEEIRTAVAEARCAASSGLSARTLTLERVHRKRVNARYATEVGDRRVLEHRALGRARDIVQKG
jgi:hypothetical protein